MKKDKIYILTEIGKWVFFLGMPLFLFFWKCTTLFGIDGGSKFILGCSGYIFGLLLYLCARKFLFKTYFANLNGKIVNFETELETEIEAEKISLIEKALQKHTLVRDTILVIPTLLILGLSLTLIKAMESGLVTLFSVVGLSTISYLLGYICMLIQNKNIKSKNRV